MKLMDTERRMMSPLLTNQMRNIQKKHLNCQMHWESTCLRRAWEIWAEGVAEAVDVEAEAEGVVTTIITTINTTTATTSNTITKTATTTVTTGVVPIQLELRHPATQSRLSSSNSNISSRSRHSHSQELTNSLQDHACPMAHVDSPWAEGSHKHRHPVYPPVNLEFESRNGGGETHRLLVVMLIEIW